MVDETGDLAERELGRLLGGVEHHLRVVVEVRREFLEARLGHQGAGGRIEAEVASFAKGPAPALRGLAELGEAGGDAANLPLVGIEGMHDDLEGLAGAETEVRDQPKPARLGVLERDRGSLTAGDGVAALRLERGELGFLLEGVHGLQGVGHEHGIEERQQAGEQTAHGPERSRQTAHADAGGASRGDLLVPVHGRQHEDDRDQQGDRDEQGEIPDQAEKQVRDDGAPTGTKVEELRDAVIPVRQQHDAHETQQGQGEDLGPFGEEIAVQKAHGTE